MQKGLGGQPYGQHYILDMAGCDTTRFCRTFIKGFMKNTCEILKLKVGPLHFWDYVDPHERAQAPKHLAGISAVQFIETSNIIIHCIDHLGRVMIDVFACGELNASHNNIYLKQFNRYSRIYWRASYAQDHIMWRGSLGYPDSPTNRYRTIEGYYDD